VPAIQRFGPHYRFLLLFVGEIDLSQMCFNSFNNNALRKIMKMRQCRYSQPHTEKGCSASSAGFFLIGKGPRHVVTTYYGLSTSFILISLLTKCEQYGILLCSIKPRVTGLMI